MGGGAEDTDCASLVRIHLPMNKDAKLEKEKEGKIRTKKQTHTQSTPPVVKKNAQLRNKHTAQRATA